jgi:hypothetical protein
MEDLKGCIKKVFDYLVLGKQGDADIANVLKESKADSLGTLTKNGLQSADKEKAIAALVNADKKLNKYINDLYMDNVFSILFYMGSFGMVPDDRNARALDAEEFKTKCPDAKIGKNEADGIFFALDNDVNFGIVSERRYVSMDRK